MRGLFNRGMRLPAVRVALALVLLWAPGLHVTDLAAKELQVLGTASGGANWRRHESRFWQQEVPAASGGRLTASAKPLDELGLAGTDALHMLKLGTYDAVHGLVSYAAPESVVLQGLDLPGVAQDYAAYRQVVSAYRPVVSRVLREQYNARLLALYPFPSQQIWCNLGEQPPADISLKTLAGKKIRTVSTATSDFVDGIGATSVAVAPREMVPALKRGVADCGIADTVQAYNQKWWRAATHRFGLRLGYATAFLAVNMDSWAQVDTETQRAIETRAAALEDTLWQDNTSADDMAVACNEAGPCPFGPAGGVKPVLMSDEDLASLKEIFEQVVLARWAARCGDACAKEWTETAGQVTGLTAKAR